MSEPWMLYHFRRELWMSDGVRWNENTYKFNTQNELTESPEASEEDDTEDYDGNPIVGGDWIWGTGADTVQEIWPPSIKVDEGDGPSSIFIRSVEIGEELTAWIETRDSLTGKHWGIYVQYHIP